MNVYSIYTETLEILSIRGNNNCIHLKNLD